MTKFQLKLNDETYDVEVTRDGSALQVVRDGQTAVLHIIHQDGSAVILEQEHADGRRQRFRAAVHREGDKRQAWVDGRVFHYERMRQRGSGGSAADSGSLAASIPAVVTELLVSEGDAVAAGDKLILLESMKMVIPIQAPYAGTVTAVKCTAGDSVQAGVPLIELEKTQAD
ncbi:MAG: acetyl-CoA carboxylase biotin carboxyl carrier protein subunit [Anaerolineae bacterium]